MKGPKLFASSAVLATVLLPIFAGCARSARPFDQQDVKTLGAKLNIGMSESEVVSILGQPNHRIQRPNRIVFLYTKPFTYPASRKVDESIKVAIQNGKVSEIQWLDDAGVKIIK